MLSLLPRPREVDPDVSPYSLDQQRFSSSLFVKLGKEFFRFNLANKRANLSLRRYLEVKNKSRKVGNNEKRTLLRYKMFYSGREQRKIIKDKFAFDGINLTVQTKEFIVELICDFMQN